VHAGDGSADPLVERRCVLGEPCATELGRAQDEGVESHALSVEEGREAGGVA